MVSDSLLIPRRTWLMMRKTTGRIASMAGKLLTSLNDYITAAQLYESLNFTFISFYAANNIRHCLVNVACNFVHMAFSVGSTDF